MYLENYSESLLSVQVHSTVLDACFKVCQQNQVLTKVFCIQVKSSIPTSSLHLFILSSTTAFESPTKTGHINDVMKKSKTLLLILHT